MTIADLKNDFVFRRIFAKHPDIFRGMLNDLLGREGDREIENIDYLPSQHLPVAVGAKLSILGARCRDRAGTTFIVEMQLLHFAGFVNRVVYNACKAVGPLKAGESFAPPTDVVTISICDFVLWPDAEKDAAGLARVPMFSQWNMTEPASGNQGVLQVQYAFLELRKLGSRRPDVPGVDLWAWLFVHAPELTEVPTDLPIGPYREALELANEATFSQLEFDAYRRVMDEIQQTREYGDAQRAAGKAEGLARLRAVGVAAGMAEAILAVLAARGLAVDSETRQRITACTDVAALNRWIARAATVASAHEVIADT